MSGPPDAELSEADQARIALIGAALACVAALGQSFDEANEADDKIDLAAYKLVNALEREA